MHEDHVMEKEIQELNLTAPRVTPEVIDALVEKLTFHTYVIPGTTATVASAITEDGFVLAVEMMACASPENFNKEFGEKYAINKAKESARNKLWTLEGYALKKYLTQANN
jgi:hypothetical protein